MRVAGDRRPRYALAQEPSAPVYEFTIERRTESLGGRFRFESDVQAARTRVARTRSKDMTATIRAATATDAIAAFEAATGEEARVVTMQDGYGSGARSVEIARVSVIVTGFTQVFGSHLLRKGDA